MGKHKKDSLTAQFVSLGCFKNTVDTEVLGGMLEERGIRIVSSYEPADWLIINTCGFIQEAKEESISEIVEALEKKEKAEVSHLAVFGCLIQRYPQELQRLLEKADLVWGVNDFAELADAIASGQKKKYNDRCPFLYSDHNRRIISTPANTTFIKISEGCDMGCSFCAIPSIRGRYRSRPIASILEEARRYKDLGFSELNLISQNSTFFGKDRHSRSLLPRLLEEISKLGFPWVRVLYLMPEEVTPEIIEAFSLPTVLAYFDLPFQHVSRPVLEAMKRGGNFQKNMRLIEKIRHRFEQAVIRSTFIVGFPGESEKDFSELKRFARLSRIERIGVFGFSAEENTEAFKLANPVAPGVIESRKEELLDISDENLKKFNDRLLGSNQLFLPQGPWDNASTIGRISSQAPEVDGLTRIDRPFGDDYRVCLIRIRGFQNELLVGEKTNRMAGFF